MLTGTAADYWNVLWPGASNGAAVGFLVASRAPGDLRPRTVRGPPVQRPMQMIACGLCVAWCPSTTHSHLTRPLAVFSRPALLSSMVGDASPFVKALISRTVMRGVQRWAVAAQVTLNGNVCSAEVLDGLWMKVWGR